MKASGRQEYQRFMGFPASRVLEWKALRRSPAEDRKRPGPYRTVRHPIMWIRWRIAIRRLGPYAPDFKDFRRGLSPASNKWPFDRD